MFLSFLVATPPALSDSKFFFRNKPGSDNNPCYWFSLSSSYFTHSLINHKLLLSFTPSPITHTQTHCNSTTRPPLPSQPLWLPENCTIAPCFPCPVLPFLVPFSLGFIYDTVPQPVWPPITMTTGGKHLSSQTGSRFSQPHVQLWALMLLDVYSCDCVVDVYVCVHMLKNRNWTWHYNVLDITETFQHF